MLASLHGFDSPGLGRVRCIKSLAGEFNVSDGGSGADVSVVHDGAIETHGSDSHGIIAQSVGGGGGNAVANMDFSCKGFNAPDPAEALEDQKPCKEAGNGKIGISIGRMGGSGGEAGNVSLTSAGSVITRGDRSYGLLAQSIGNGGGNSSATTLSIETAEDKDSNTPARGGSISIGIKGGMGGFAGDVVINASGLVATEGDSAHAIFAQSVGGGGGNGGDASAKSANASISMGGSGGEGGYGGEITIVSAAEVQTFGANSMGIIGQSIGGGGGNGGKSTATVTGSEIGVAVSLGGDGGVGAVSGNVTIENSGLIVTEGQGSYGVLAQSLGGGGGNANVSIAKLKTEAPKEEDKDKDKETEFNAQVGISIGGVGGEGAEAGEVAVTNTGTVVTMGNGAVGIYAQSIGGGGGNAAQTINKFTGPGAKINIGLGGEGGEGAAGGTVTVENIRDANGNAGEIITLGDDAHGIVAMSIGGGGGTGGTTVVQNEDQMETMETIELLSEDDPDLQLGFGLSMSLGGDGGMGGTSGLVTVINDGNIQTFGKNAHGIFAQSIGGGGGNAGASYTDSIGNGKLNKSPERNMSIGGEGGSGNVSGDVYILNTGSIEVFGDNSYGIFAQSIGGGGGNGGVAGRNPDLEAEPIGPLGIDPTNFPDPTVNNFAVGGAGGEGADSGNVVVDHLGSIVAHGDNSYGIFAQTIAGGGGTMGASLASPAGSAIEFAQELTVGSRDGGSGEAGTVTVNTEGTIVMLGENSHSHLVQSVNGGGGDLDFDFDVSQARVEQGVVDPRSSDGDQLTAVVNLLIGIGSTAVEEGYGAAIESDHVGDLIALGSNSTGSFAQSVGGGGGSGLIQLTTNETTDVALDLALGGADSENSSGGDIMTSRDGNVSTVGDSSSGTSIQTIGGGGGSVIVVVTEESDEEPVPDPESSSKLVQIAVPESDLGPVKPTALSSGSFKANTNTSTQPSARAGVASESITLGSSNSIDNDGGAVELTYASDSMTTGTLPTLGEIAIPESDLGPVKPTALSSGSFKANTNTSTQPSARAGVASASITLGSSNSIDNDGGAVDLTYAGESMTMGTLSPGLQVQSIGGGGGDARIRGLGSLSVSLGGQNGASGDGGDIMLDNVGSVTTYSDRSHGVILQSIGGGGGLVLSDVDESAVSISLSADNSGSGGDIEFNQIGDIVAFGDDAIALLVQSIGGGGGAVDQAFLGSAGGTGSSGNILLDIDGDLIANGDSGVGVFAQSVGSDGQGDIDLTLAEDHAIVGGDRGVAVWFSGGAINTFTNYGVVTTTEGVQGMGILSDDGDNTIDNYGVVVGNVDLGYGINSFTNHVDAIFAPGADVQLGGPSNWLSNFGTLIAGDMGYAQSVALNGSYLQAESATNYAEIDFASGQIDQVLATGTVELAGHTDISLLNVANIPIGRFRRLLFSGDEGLVDNGMTFETAPSVVITYDLNYNANEAVLDYNINFVPEGMSENLNAVGDYINRVQIAGGGNAAYGAVVTKLVYDPDMETYRYSLSQISPEFYGEQQVQLINSSADFGQRMMSCRQATGNHRFNREGSCVWLQHEQLSLERDSHGDYKQMEGSTSRLSVGAQKTFPSDWSFGFGFTREASDTEGYEESWRAQGRTNHLGASVKRRLGPSKFSGVLSYGWSEIDSFRSGEFINDFTAMSARDMSVMTGTLRYSYDYEWDTWYLRPFIDAGVAHLKLDATSEQGNAGPIGLEFAEHNENHLWLRPAIETGKEFTLATDWKLRLNLMLGAQKYLDDASTDVKTWLAGTPMTVDPMSVAQDLGDPRYGGRLGVELFSSNNFFATFYYMNNWYDYSDSDTAMLRFQFPLR